MQRRHSSGPQVHQTYSRFRPPSYPGSGLVLLHEIDHFEGGPRYRQASPCGRATFTRSRPSLPAALRRREPPHIHPARRLYAIQGIIPNTSLFYQITKPVGAQSGSSWSPDLTALVMTGGQGSAAVRCGAPPQTTWRGRRGTCAPRGRTDCLQNNRCRRRSPGNCRKPGGRCRYRAT